MTAPALVISCAGRLLSAASLPYISSVTERRGVSGAFRLVSPHSEAETPSPPATRTHPGLAGGAERDMKCWNRNRSWQIKFLSFPLCAVLTYAQGESKGLPLHGLLTRIFLLALRVQKPYFSTAVSLPGVKQKYSLDIVLTWNNANFDIGFHLINEI